MVALCSVDRSFVMVVERALATESVTPTFIPDPTRPLTHYLVMVEDDEVDQPPWPSPSVTQPVPLHSITHLPPGISDPPYPVAGTEPACHACHLMGVV